MSFMESKIWVLWRVKYGFYGEENMGFMKREIFVYYGEENISLLWR